MSTAQLSAAQRETLAAFCSMSGMPPNDSTIELLHSFDFDMDAASAALFDNDEAPPPPPRAQTSTSTSSSSSSSSSAPPRTAPSAHARQFSFEDFEDEHGEPLFDDEEVDEAHVGEVDEDGVRAPLPETNERLIGDFGADAVAALRRVILPMRDFAREDALATQKKVQAAFASSSKPEIANSFAPPVDLLFSGDFDMARDEAARTGKWLVVSIQNAMEFESLMVLRDLLRSRRLGALLAQRCIFWQRDLSTDGGRLFAQFYRVDEAPYFAILQPLTKNVVRAWRPADFVRVNQQPRLDLEVFLREFTECLDTNRLHSLPTATGASSAPLSSSSSSSSSSSAGIPPPRTAAAAATRQCVDLNDDEALQEAIAASLRDRSDSESDECSDTRPPKRRKVVTVIDSDSDSDSDADVIEIRSTPAAAAAAAATTSSSTTAAAAATSTVATATKATPVIDLDTLFPVPPEPDAGAPSDACTRIQFQLGSGRTAQRRFARADTTRDVYAYVLTQCTDDERAQCRDALARAAGDGGSDSATAAPRALAFHLVTSFPKSMVPLSEQTLAASGLLNTKLVLEWL